MITVKRYGRIAVSVAAALILASGQMVLSTAQAAEIQFDIESQPLAKALNTWANQSGLQVIWPAGDPAAYVNSASVQGSLEPMDALRVLLEGTGLSYSVIGNGKTVAIHGKERRVGLQGTASVTGVGGGDSNAVRVAAAGEPVGSGSSELTLQGRGAPGEAEAEKKNLEELQEIVVTGTHIRGAAPTGSSVTVYGREEIDRSGAGNVAQFLRTIPENFASIDGGTSQVNGGSPDATSNAWFGATVNLHGLGSGATLILLNGQRTAPAGAEGEFVDVSLIPLSAVDRIEVLSDGASAIYGADAVAGVVNFILRNDYEGAETTLRYGDSTRGGGAEVTASQLLGTRWDGGSAMLVYEHQTQNALFARQRDFVPVDTEAGVSGAFTLHPQMRRNGVFTTVRQEIGGIVALFGQGYWNKRDFEQTSLIGDLGGGRTESYIVGHAEQVGGSIGITRQLGSQWDLEVVGNASRLEQDLTQRNVALGVIQPLDFVSTLASLDIRSDGPLFLLPAGAVRASIGLSGRREGTDVGEVPPVPQFASDRNVFSGYGEVLIPLVAARKGGREPQLALSLAGRHDHYEDFGSASQPKVGLHWAPFESWALRGSYSRSYKAPTLIQRHESMKFYQMLSIPNPAESDGVTETMLISGLGNASLQPERAKSLSAGVDYKPKDLPGLSMSATYFQVRFSDRISGPPLVGTTFDIYTEPALSSFISRDITSAEIDRILAEEFFENYSGSDFTGSVDPHLTEAFFDFRSRNIAVTKESGLDFSANYGFELEAGTVDLFLAGTKLFKLDYQVAPGTATANLLNRTYRPMDLRLRGGAGWARDGFAISAAINFSDGYENNLVAPTGRVDSWLTADFQLRYELGERSQAPFLRETTLSLSIVNATNEDPPSIRYGGLSANFNYDAANASPRGRFISVQVGKRW